MTSRRIAPARKAALAMWVLRVAIACFGLCCGIARPGVAALSDPIVLIAEGPRADQHEGRPDRRQARSTRVPRGAHVPRATVQCALAPKVLAHVTDDLVLVPRRYQRFCALLC